VLVPARLPPHKPIEDDPGGERRLAMCRLLVADCEGLTVSALELERDGPSYTVDTLRSIHSSNPQAELTLILGADIAATLPSWHEPRQLLELASPAIAARAGSDTRGLADTLGVLSPHTSVRFLHGPVPDVSSSQVRERSLAGEPIDELVGGAVAEYIGEHGLYGARSRAAS
jgi:nicotinate-nucleotide adenylyltransferase